MNLDSYVQSLRQQLAVAAAAGGDDAIAVAERLVGPLDAGIRLVLQEALADAAEEITRELAPGSIELRLRGRDLAFAISAPPSAAPAGAADDDAVPPPPPAPMSVEPAGEGGTSRISFRPPEHLKAQIEAAAEREGVSVNAFLVRTLTDALRPGGRRRRGNGGSSLTGWVQ